MMLDATPWLQRSRYYMTQIVGDKSDEHCINKLYEKRKLTTMDEKLELKHVSILYGTVRSNSIEVVSPVTRSPVGRGFFPLTAKINHCCNPTVMLTLVKGKLAAIATRDIKVGEHVTYDYWGMSCIVPRKIRKQMIEGKYRFKCTCYVCQMRQDITVESWTVAVESSVTLKKLDEEMAPLFNNFKHFEMIDYLSQMWAKYLLNFKRRPLSHLMMTLNMTWAQFKHIDTNSQHRVNTLDMLELALTWLNNKEFTRLNDGSSRSLLPFEHTVRLGMVFMLFKPAIVYEHFQRRKGENIAIYEAFEAARNRDPEQLNALFQKAKPHVEWLKKIDPSYILIDSDKSFNFLFDRLPEFFEYILSQ